MTANDTQKQGVPLGAGMVMVFADSIALNGFDPKYLVSGRQVPNSCIIVRI